MKRFRIRRKMSESTSRIRKSHETVLKLNEVQRGMGLRSPICTVVGHVDHGKTTLLDTIRASGVAAQEAGAITQAIGASIIPIATIKDLCGASFPQGKVTVPGILFIDTPGHAAFTSLRRRGGSLADIAILIVNLHEGFKPQTKEAIEILKTYKTPFVVAANKLDLTPGYRKQSENVAADIAAQEPRVQEYLETKLYEIVGALSEMGIHSERFDRVQDFRTQAAIVPLSALTGHGLPDLLLVILGLAQKFLEEGLRFIADGPGKGVILEVKEEQGLGTTLDVILYDGTLAVGDSIAIGTLGEPIVTRVRALLEPNPNVDVRDRKAAFKPVERVTAAIGVKIAAPGTDGVIAGMPVIAAKDANTVRTEFSLPAEMIEGEQEGIIIKADTLGSIEALIHLFRAENVSVHRAAIGSVSKKDVAEALSQPQPVIIAFNVEITQGISTQGVTIIRDNIIYNILQRYTDYLTARERGETALVRPCKIELLRNHIFRQSNPLIAGTYIIGGELSTGMRVMKEGVEVGVIKDIQENKESVGKASAGKSVAVSYVGPTAGRQVSEGDVLYSVITEEQFRQLRAAVKKLSEAEKSIVREIATSMRKTNPLWGV